MPNAPPEKQQAKEMNSMARSLPFAGGIARTVVTPVRTVGNRYRAAGQRQKERQHSATGFFHNIPCSMKPDASARARIDLF